MERLTLICLALALSACSVPRKARNRCDRADRLIARAVWKCPDVLKRDSVKASFTIPADSTSGGAVASPVVVDDSLRAMISQLSEALFAEDTLNKLDTVFRVDTVIVTRYIDRLRERICDFPAVDTTDMDLHLRIWYDKESRKIRWSIVRPERTIEKKVEGNPTVVQAEAREVARAPWFRFPWIELLVILIAAILGYRYVWFKRNQKP